MPGTRLKRHQLSAAPWHPRPLVPHGPSGPTVQLGGFLSSGTRPGQLSAEAERIHTSVGRLAVVSWPLLPPREPPSLALRTETEGEKDEWGWLSPWGPGGAAGAEACHGLSQRTRPVWEDSHSASGSLVGSSLQRTHHKGSKRADRVLRAREPERVVVMEGQVSRGVPLLHP